MVENLIIIGIAAVLISAAIVVIVAIVRSPTETEQAQKARHPRR